LELGHLVFDQVELFADIFVPQQLQSRAAAEAAAAKTTTKPASAARAAGTSSGLGERFGSQRHQPSRKDRGHHQPNRDFHENSSKNPGNP
jgi:hypothetical protein